MNKLIIITEKIEEQIIQHIYKNVTDYIYPVEIFFPKGKITIIYDREIIRSTIASSLHYLN